MSIPEAIKGARVELAKLPPLQRIPLLARYARIFAAELFGTVLAVPFGLRAFSLHRSLPDARQQRAGSSVSILRDVRYGGRERNLMDIYLPPNIELQGGQLEGILSGADGQAGGAPASTGNGSTAGSGSGAPVVLFCHGGVWASGSAWHYAPLATRLAQAGVITAVMQYTLYPNALVPQMVAEVSRALTWTLDNAEQLGGSPQQVSLVGHSAGAHMCTMALLHRALAASKAAASRAAAPPATASTSTGGSNGNVRAAAAAAAPAAASPAAQQAGPELDSATQASGAAQAMGPAEEAAAHEDARMPCRLVAMAGVYDIAKHFEYEEARHVHKLSTMERAIGGPERFPHQSPAVILANALRRQHLLQQRHRSWAALAADPRELLQEAGVLNSGTAWDSVLSDHEDAAGQPASGPHCTLVRPPPAQQAAVAAVEEAAPGEAGAGQRPPADAVAAARYYQSFELAGEAIARRIGFDRVAAAEASAAEAAAEAASAAAAAGGTPRDIAAAAAAAAARRAVAVAAVPPEDVPTASAEASVAAAAARGAVDSSGIMALTVEAARRLPPIVLTSSCTDITVPWYESAEMYWMLRDCGVPAKHLVYNKVSHGDFVTAWAALPRLSGNPTADTSDLQPQCADLVKVVSGSAQVRYS